jgi:type IV pilus assembly protein PilE
MLKRRGFTLIELMIVVAVIAVLAAVGYPSYTDYVLRGKITEAISGLSSARVNMERWFQDNRTYAGGCIASVLPPATSNFTFACQGTPNATNYVIAATGQNAMANFTYTVDQSGGKQTLSVPTAKGWALPNPNNCWALKKDGSC